MGLVRGNIHFVLKVAVLLFLASHDKLGPLRGVLSDSDHDIWPFDDLKKDMDAKGQADNTWSPVGKGLYLDGTSGTYVKLKKHDKDCLEHPSDCDITIGFFLKFWPPTGLQIYFGNKDADEELYEGINIYHNGHFRVEVYGRNKFCSRVLSPPEGVWFYLGLVWEKNGNLAVYQDRWYSPSSWQHEQCGYSPGGLKTRGDYYLGRDTYPDAFYKDLNIWSSKQSRNVLDERWDAAFEISGSTEIGLKIIFPDLAFNSGSEAQWREDFSEKVNDLYNETYTFEEIKDISVTDSNGQVAVSFTLKFSAIFWRNVLDLQLAMENGNLLGSPGVMDEASCTSGSHKFICEAPKNANPSAIASTSVKITMDTVFVPLHESYFYGYRILYKNLEDPGSEWTPGGVIRLNVDPIVGVVSGLVPYTNYSFRVFAKSFLSVGLISEPFKVRTLESVPDVGPEIIAYYNTSSSSIYVEWNHSIPHRNVRGILVGYRVAWDEDYFSSGDSRDSQGHADVGLDTSNYTVTSLHEHWLYNVGVAGRTSIGHGTYSTVTVMTGEDVPTAPPSYVHLHMTNESALNANWYDVPLIHRNGVILGYRLLLQREDGGPVVWNVTVGPDVRWYMFTNLNSFQIYSTQILAFTIKGEGPLSANVSRRTDGSVPINFPVNITAHNVSSSEINVTWYYNADPHLVLGILEGFLLYFLEANASDYFTEDAALTTHSTDTRRSTRVGGLKIFRLYNISIAARTVKGPGPTNESVVVRTHGEVPGASPQALTAYNTSVSSIYASWKEIVADKQHGIMQGYKLFFYEVTREGGLKILENHTYELAVHETTFTGLKIYTKYRTEVQGFNNYGDGPVAAVEAFTEEGIPTRHPSNFTAFNRSSTIIRATWRPVPECCQLGVIKGYHVSLTDSSNSSARITNTVAELYTRFTNLKKFHLYQLSITAFTSKGSGPSASTTASTDQDVPEAPPQNVSGYNMSQTEIQLFWAPVPADKVNGNLTGYKVSYRKAQGSHPVKYKSFNSSSLQGVIDGLSPFTIYNLDVRALTIKGDGIPSPFITVQTEEEAPQVAPRTFQGFNSSSTSIVLSWDPIPEWQVAGILRNFHITYRQLDTADNTTYNITLPITSLTLEITNLQKYTNYSFHIKGVTKFVGAATEIIVTTDEDVPSLPPQDIKIQNSSSTSISARWKPIPKDHINGILLGIKLVYRSASRDNSIVFSSRARRSTEEDWSEYTIITLPPGALSYEMTSLKKFTNYSVVILGFTSKGDGNVSHQFVVSTDEDVPGASPQALTAYNTSVSSIYASWKEIVADKQHGIMQGYKLFFYEVTREGGLKILENHTYELAVHETTFTGLKIYTKYRTEVQGFNNYGDGPVAAVEAFTEEGIPTQHPSNFTAFNRSSTIIRATWRPVPECCQLGVIKGYHVSLTDSSNSSARITNTVAELYTRFTNLKKFHLYQLSITAFTSKGSGPSASTTASTDQDVPEAPPQNVSGYNMSQTEIQLFWAPVPADKVNGILTGYKVSYRKAQGSHPVKYKSFNSSSLQGVIDGLSPFTIYNLDVRALTIKGDGIPSPFITVQTEEEAPQVAPRTFQGFNSSSTSIVLSWDPIPEWQVAGILRNFHITYRQLDTADNTTYNITLPITSLTLEITNLQKYTNYSFHIKGVTKFVGAATEIIVTTDEDVPSLPPQDIKIQNSSSTSISARWKPIPKDHINGILFGIKLVYRSASRDNSIVFSSRARRSTEEDWSEYTIITLPPGALSYEMTSLKKFTNYSVVILGFTSKGDGNVSHQFVVSTDEDVPGASPQALTAYNTSVSSIYASWKEIVADKQHGIMQGYKLFFYEVTREGGLKILENHTYELAVHETTFTGLKIYTKYRTEVQGFNNYGDGPVAAVEAFTEEGIPTRHPSNFTAFNRSSTIIRATWRPVPECCQLGVIKGYHVSLTDSSNSSARITNTVAELYTRFTNLKKFHLYQLSITAFTSKGSGPSASTTASTDQDVPEAPPQNVSGYNMSQTEIQLFWALVPADKVNGILTGYKVSYRKAQGSHPVNYKSFNSSSLQGVIDGLSPFTIYNLDVRAFTIKGDGIPSPFITVQTEEEAPQVAPRTFQGFNSSSTSIVLSWDPIPEWQVAGILRNFHITYRQLDTADNTTYNITLPITSLTLEITNLQKYTNYSFHIKGVTKFVGAATEIIVTTDEDVPSLPPQDIKIQNSSSTSISARWKPIPKDHINGILLGIKLVYRSASRDNSIVFSSRARRSTEEDWLEYTSITLPPGALSYEMTSLKKFTNYSVVILGFTSKGDGNVSHQFVVSTDEDVPSMPPTNFIPISRSGDFKMSASWGPVPDGFVHGILLGYHVYYTKIQQTGRPVTSQIHKKIFGPYEFNTTILLLNNFAIYNLEIAAFTIKGDGARSQIKDGSTCNCPRVFKTTWYPFPPYITYEDGAVGGFIPRILEDAVEYCCSDCLLPNGRSASVINFELDGRGNPALKSGVEELISSIESLTDFSVPVNGYQGQTHYSIYRYVKLAESPGVAFITVMDPIEKASAIANVFIQSWPLLVLTFFMMLVAGIVMWMMEARSNGTEFPTSFFQGAPEGVWWAFVTSTTVGYGDRCPKWVLSRLFAFAWTMCGLVVIAILTGKIATALTDFGYIGPYIPLYGAEVAAIANNSDFRLGVRKNARVNTVRNYRTYEDISQALKDQEVKGALVDLYVLSSHKHLFDDPRFRIVRVYDYKASYGVVLAGHSMKLEHCFTEHIKAHTASVFQKIEENVKILKEPDDSPAEQQSTSLFSVSSPQFITAVIIIATLLLLACVLGIIYKSRRSKISKVLKQSKDLKNEMSPLVDSFLVSIKKKVETLSKRHRQDRCDVMRMERERDQQAGYAVNKYYQVLSLRDIRQQWSHRHLSVKSVATSLNGKNYYNPTLWPFTVPAKTLSPNVTPSWKHSSLPSRRKQGFDLPVAPVTLEPNVRVIDETTL